MFEVSSGKEKHAQIQGSGNRTMRAEILYARQQNGGQADSAEWGM